MNNPSLCQTVLVAACIAAAILPSTVSATSDPVAAPYSGKPAFKHRGFYLHAGWLFNYPFCLRKWSRKDFDGMFELLKRMGYDTMMYWPVTEAIPAPLSKDDEKALRGVRDIVADAKKAGLRCWFTLCPNIAIPPEIAAKPFVERNPYKLMKTVRLDDPKQAEPFLAHRTAMLRIVNNADAYVTIDGDPGGYEGAKPEDLMKVFLSDRKALDAYGTDPRHQSLVPWVWAGWGAPAPWQKDATPFSRAEMQEFKKSMPEPWEMLPGRSHRDGWANGRVNVAVAEELGLVGRSTILCYEAVEFEPSPPAAKLQFDLIRSILKREMHLAPEAQGVFANAQQPIMTLPGMYFFGRGAWDPTYLDKPDEQVLTDLATFLGGPPELLVPAWQCLSLPLARLPKDLPDRLRNARLTSKAGKCVPGGAKLYLDILASQAASRIGLLEAIGAPAKDDSDCAERLADGVAALVGWWQVHHFVMDGDQDQGFGWWFVEGSQTGQLAEWAKANAHDHDGVASAAAKRLVERKVLGEKEAPGIVRALFE